MAQAPSVDSVGLSSATLAVFDRLDVHVFLSATYQNPYDYDEVRVWGEFLEPGGKGLRIDGFYMEGYEFKGNQGAIQESGEQGFFLRFSPQKTGTYELRVWVEDKNGTDSSDWISFECMAHQGSKKKGYIRKTRSNYLEFDNGDTFLPVGHNIAWPNGSAYANYTAWLSALKAGGGNYFRLWHCHWGLSLEWKGFGYGGLKDYMQSKAFYLDWLHEYCEVQDIYVMLCLHHHGQVSTQVNPNWSDNPYNAANGGMCPTTLDFFTDSMAKAYTKNRLRYIVARWGYSRSILAWELLNEADWTNGFEQHLPEIADWHQEMAQFIKAIDPNQHLITTSLAEENGHSLLWTLPEIDFSQTHKYLPTSNIERALARASKEQLDTYDKPTLIGEFGISTDGQGLSNLDPRGIHFHNGLWGSFFGGSLGTGAYWWWGRYIHAQNLYHHYSGFSTLLSSIPLKESAYVPAPSYVEGARGELKLIPDLGWGFKGQKHIWVSKDGREEHNYSLAGFLYGKKWNSQHRSPPNFIVDFDRAGSFVIKTGSGHGKKPEISIYLNGILVLKEDGHVNTRYKINVPSGRHSIKVENTGKDWIGIASYIFEGIGSAVDAYALVSEDKSSAVAWLLNHRYNHEEIAFSGLPKAVSGAELSIPHIEAGSYEAQWYDCMTAGLKKSEIVHSDGTNLKIPIPKLDWDLFLALDRVTILSTEKARDEVEMSVYPNPFLGKKLSVRGDFEEGREGEALLIDLHGRPVRKWTIRPHPWKEMPFSLSLEKRLSPGYYWLSLEVGNRKGVVCIQVNE